MLDQLKEIIERYADVNPDDIRGDTKLVEELGLTSFAVMGMMGDIEEEFDIAVDEAELADIVTLDDLMAYIEKKQA
ncbi:MAG: acyl carrier protein [Candidatus Limivicinus sp.]|jgi:acyl carrier protein